MQEEQLLTQGSRGLWEEGQDVLLPRMEGPGTLRQGTEGSCFQNTTVRGGEWEVVSSLEEDTETYPRAQTTKGLL